MLYEYRQWDIFEFPFFFLIYGFVCSFSKVLYYYFYTALSYYIHIALYDHKCCVLYPAVHKVRAAMHPHVKWSLKLPM